MAFSAGDVLTANTLNGVATSYTPAWTSAGTQPAIVNGSIVGSYSVVGRRVLFSISVTMGSSTTFGTGSYYFSLPSTPTGPIVGSATITDTGTALHIATLVQSSGTVLLVVEGETVYVGQTIPHTWASTDTLVINGEYFI